MKLSGIFDRANDLVYFLVESRCMLFPVPIFFSQHPGLKLIRSKHEQELARIFSSKSVSLKSYSIIFCPYNCSVVRLVIDQSRSAILGQISGLGCHK